MKCPACGGSGKIRYGTTSDTSGGNLVIWRDEVCCACNGNGEVQDLGACLTLASLLDRLERIVRDAEQLVAGMRQHAANRDVASGNRKDF